MRAVVLRAPGGLNQLEPSDGIDGYATEYVVRPAHYFTHAPACWGHSEAASLSG